MAPMLAAFLLVLSLHSGFCERDRDYDEDSLEVNRPDDTPSSKGTVHDTQFRMLGGLDGDFKVCKPNLEVIANSEPKMEWNTVTMNLRWLEAKSSLGYYQYAFVDSKALLSSNDEALDEEYLGWCYRWIHEGENDRMSEPETCLCGTLRFKATGSTTHGDLDVALKFAGCNEPKPLAQLGGLTALSSFGQVPQTPHKIMWEHPQSLFVEVSGDAWCKMDMEENDAGWDSSVLHAMPYCVLCHWVKITWMQHLVDTKLNEGVIHASEQEVRLQVLASALYDHQSSTKWFASNQVRYKLAWKNLAENFRMLTSSNPRLKVGALLRASAGWQQELQPPMVQENPEADAAIGSVLKAGSALCNQMHATHDDAYEATYEAFVEYQKTVAENNKKTHEVFGVNITKEMSPPVLGRKPLFLIVGGPPSSGKSLTSLSPKDFELIQDKTSQGAFGTRSWEELQRKTVEINVDRMVDSTNIMIDTKAYLATEEKWSKAFDIEDRDMKKRQDDERQRQYWRLRKKEGMDDLSNAYISYCLAMGYDVIYETLLGNNWIPWALEYELPKAKAAGYQIVLINYVVPVNDLILRAAMREKATGQTAAPAAQIEKDAVAAPRNFMNNDLLENLDYAISMTHVKNGGVEDALAIFQGAPRSCFSHCASSAMLKENNAQVLQRCHMAMCSEE